MRVAANQRYVSSGTLAFAGATLVSVGAIAALVLTPISHENEISDPGEISSIEVTWEWEYDARVASFEGINDRTFEIGIVDSGRVTRVECFRGGSLISGESPVTVDDRPSLLLATEIPPWRDLGLGSRGEDVRALQVELVRLGFDVEISGVFRNTTRDALRRLFSDAGQSSPNGVLLVSQVIWIPEPELVISSCGVEVGDMSGDGPLATTGSVLRALSMTSELAGALPGERVVRLDDIVATVSPNGRIADEGLLQLLRNDLQPESSHTGPPQFELEVTLASPLRVTIVPPAALFGLSNDRGCVTVDGVARPVRIITSHLGRTSVEFVGDSPPHVDMPPQMQHGVCHE